MAKQRVLIVDDDEAIRTSTAESLARHDREVRTAESATAALTGLDRWRPEVVLSDVRMPGIDGLELLQLLTERLPDADVIMMTAFDDMPTIVSAMRAGAVEFLVKPLDLRELRHTVDRLFADRAERKNGGEDAPPPSLDVLVGRDPRMIGTFKLIGQAAAVRSTVLIRGESGTGKELVARAIHANSAQSAAPFVPVNCAALPATLLESELFGHVRGSFTGATNDRRGRFAIAGKGTIFLDEIGDTSLEFQTKLLRVLQDREYQPVGSEKTEQTEARVIAATHRGLEAMIAEGKFREDLYYRLRVVEIELPPLRGRAGDIPLLAQQLVARACRAMDCDAVALSESAVRTLTAHTWPGNVRELENCLVRAIVLARGGVIRPEHLVLSTTANGHDVAFGSLEDAERDHIARVFAATGRQKTRTAEILGISRPRLDRLLQKHGLA
ncbi:MAG TPA: sigma-54 dependent transcriptional regulator [Gemmatimonadaceae bacterium]|nr:sigma-54 dependent transcriptional regulator [Gemmatimonadaceae bacterium]